MEPKFDSSWLLSPQRCSGTVRCCQQQWNMTRAVRQRLCNTTASRLHVNPLDTTLLLLYECSDFDNSSMLI